MKSTSNTLYIGVDLCKDKLDVHLPQWSSIRVFSNDLDGIRSLLKSLETIAPLDQFQIICEATGGYEKTLLGLCFANQVPISLINPRMARDFAKASGKLAKTDSIDAAVLTHYGACFEPRLASAPSQTVSDLQAVVRRRSKLVTQRAAESKTLAKTQDSFIRSDIKSLIKVLSNRIKKMDQRIEELIESDSDLREKSERMRQVNGVGPVVTATVLAELPEIGQITDKQAASLVGVAPFNNDSGPRKGKRSTKGGRERIRRTIYTPMLSAKRTNPIFRDFYDRLISKGKSHHVAVVAVMRKLISLLNRICADPDFQPSK